MKKIIITLSILLSICYNIFAISEQKLFDQNSKENIYVNFLCSYNGVIGPSSDYPITAKELSIALSRISANELPEKLQEIYAELTHTLNTPETKFTLTPQISISPQIFLSENLISSNSSRNNFFLPYNKELPSINAGLSTTFGNNIYLESELILKNNELKENIPLTSFDWLLNYTNGKLNFMGTNQTGIVGEIPFLARGSIGNSWVNLTLGRSPHSMGTAFTGNLLINDNFDYQEIIDLSFYSKYFTYDISVTHFDRQISKDEFDIESFSGKQQTRVVHRFDLNIFDKLRIALNFGTLYYCDASFDWRWFNPFMIAHNYYNYKENKILTEGDEANNINSLEIDYILCNGWKIGCQFILDQFQTFFEDKDALPSAYGFNVNLSWNGYINNNMLNIWGEFVYTNPYLYVNDKYEESLNIPNYNYDYILGYHRRDWAVSSKEYTGYPYGPNTIGLTLGLDGHDLKHSLEYKTRISYRVKGEDIDKLGSNNIKTPSGADLTHTIQLSGFIKWTDMKAKIDIFSELSLNNTWNQGMYKVNPELYLGLSYHII